MLKHIDYIRYANMVGNMVVLMVGNYRYWNTIISMIDQRQFQRTVIMSEVGNWEFSKNLENIFLAA